MMEFDYILRATHEHYLEERRRETRMRELVREAKAASKAQASAKVVGASPSLGARLMAALRATFRVPRLSSSKRETRNPKLIAARRAGL